MNEFEKTDRRGFLTGTAALGGLVSATPAIGAEPAPKGVAANPRLFCFVGGSIGGWNVVSNKAILGDPLAEVERIEIATGSIPSLPEGAKWMLRGVTSNERYVSREEKDSLLKKQAALGRKESDRGAIIPIRKSAKWWALTQSERRAIFEEKSKHTEVGLKYLPAVARRLHHCRDLSEVEPFDFITLFDFAKADETGFDEMLAAMRASEEWKYVEREVDIRIARM